MLSCYLLFSRIPGGFFRVPGLEIPIFQLLDAANPALSTTSKTR
jgi:hypothetical protein